MDIVQETFVRAYRYLTSFTGDSPFFTWTYRTAAKASVAVSRNKGRGERVDIDETDADIEAHMDPPSAAFAGPQRAALNEELKEEMDEALASLSEKHRSVLLRRELDGLSYEEL